MGKIRIVEINHAGRVWWETETLFAGVWEPCHREPSYTDALGIPQRFEHYSDAKKEVEKYITDMEQEKRIVRAEFEF